CGPQATPRPTGRPGATQPGNRLLRTGGGGYTASPTVTINGGRAAAGVAATASATVVNGVVTALNLQTFGSDYNADPTSVTISAPTSTLATASVGAPVGGRLVQSTIALTGTTPGGAGYSTAPTVAF